jgi:hypothetical protein
MLSQAPLVSMPSCCINSLTLKYPHAISEHKTCHDAPFSLPHELHNKLQTLVLTDHRAGVVVHALHNFKDGASILRLDELWTAQLLPGAFFAHTTIDPAQMYTSSIAEANNKTISEDR